MPREESLVKDLPASIIWGFLCRAAGCEGSRQGLATQKSRYRDAVRQIVFLLEGSKQALFSPL